MYYNYLNYNYLNNYQFFINSIVLINYDFITMTILTDLLTFLHYNKFNTLASL